MDSYSTIFHARGYELGDDGKVSHGVFVQWFEEAAIQASTVAGYGLAEYDALGAVWIMRDIDAEFVGTVEYGDPVAVTTWVSDFKRVQSHREYEARNATTGALLARARTQWVFWDVVKMMPRRLDPQMLARFTANGKPAVQALDWESGRLDKKVGSFEEGRRVEHDEIDQMHHVNNAVYLRWIEQQCRDAWKAWGMQPVELALTRHYVQYRQAAQDGDLLRVASEAHRDGPNIMWKHAIWREEKLIVEARSLATLCEG